MRRNAEVLAVIAAGGVIGAETRYGLDVLLRPGDVPSATLIANAGGCFLIGVLMVLLLELTAPHRLLRPFLGIGVLGGFTTFSAYTAEVHRLLDDGHLELAIGYLAAMPIIAVSFAYAGTALARSVIARRRGGHA
ncbi:MAG TPA: CrcB family protein [Jiangellaceae bacterium]